jgi:cellulose synthase/poly-beta-1,6-N-acetylglucosamine synthase-like glycosyltransferase
VSPDRPLSSAHPTVAIVCLASERPTELRRLLDSIPKAGAERIVVVNNSRVPIRSNDLPVPVELIECGAGVNVSRARNVGWRACSSDIILFVDDDNVLGEGCIPALQSALLHDSVGMAAPLLYSLHTPSRLLSPGTTRSMLTTRTRAVKPPPGSPTTWDILDQPSCYAVRRTALETIGGFDEVHFPMHYEEADLAARLRATGWRIVATSNASVHHRSPASTWRIARHLDTVALTSSCTRVTLQIRARYWFHQQHSQLALHRAVGGYLAPTGYAILALIDTALTQGIPAARKTCLAKGIFRGMRQGISGLQGVTGPC